MAEELECSSSKAFFYVFFLHFIKWVGVSLTFWQFVICLYLYLYNFVFTLLHRVYIQGSEWSEKLGCPHLGLPQGQSNGKSSLFPHNPPPPHCDHIQTWEKSSQRSPSSLVWEVMPILVLMLSLFNWCITIGAFVQLLVLRYTYWCYLVKLDVRQAPRLTCFSMSKRVWNPD